MVSVSVLLCDCMGFCFLKRSLKYEKSYFEYIVECH